MIEFNLQLCEERHERIDDGMKNINMRLDKVENRFIVFLTLLCANLLGVVGSLFLLLTR